MKIFCTVCIHLILLFTLLACDNSTVSSPQINQEVYVEIPSITIRSDDTSIPYISRLVDTSDNLHGRSGVFKKIKTNQSKIPYIQLGEEIQLKLQHDPPVSYTLFDDILNENGTRKYSHLSTQEVIFHFEDRIGTFLLTPNAASYLSSDSQNYSPGKTIRGFTLVCYWDNQTVEYSFIVRTDAS
ncbi:hypothetical protein [Paenibacillus sp. IITD108]|uniref:hypothetical protein n=1 Tax=Paenibacillus sp. IITD108 TaxID=3116649 RepID=UPI002F3E971A